jgi:hypothetical protein
MATTTRPKKEKPKKVKAPLSAVVIAEAQRLPLRPGARS